MRTFREFAENASHGIDSPEFKAWFAGSRVVDKDGKPALCYHGTVGDFTQFKTEPDEFSKLYSGDVGAGMLGPFFTESPKVGETYPHSYNLGEKPQVMTAYLRIRNPVKYRSLPKLREDMLKFYGGMEKFYSQDVRLRVATARELAKAFKAQLKQQGHDGILFKEGPSWQPNKRDMQANTWVPFSNEQIMLVSKYPRPK